MERSLDRPDTRKWRHFRGLLDVRAHRIVRDVAVSRDAGRQGIGARRPNGSMHPRSYHIKQEVVTGDHHDVLLVGIGNVQRDISQSIVFENESLRQSADGVNEAGCGIKAGKMVAHHLCVSILRRGLAGGIGAEQRFVRTAGDHGVPGYQNVPIVIESRDGAIGPVLYVVVRRRRPNCFPPNRGKRLRRISMILPEATTPSAILPQIPPPPTSVILLPMNERSRAPRAVEAAPWPVLGFSAATPPLEAMHEALNNVLAGECALCKRKIYGRPGRRIDAVGSCCVPNHLDVKRGVHLSQAHVSCVATRHFDFPPGSRHQMYPAECGGASAQRFDTFRLETPFPYTKGPGVENAKVIKDAQPSPMTELPFCTTIPVFHVVAV